MPSTPTTAPPPAPVPPAPRIGPVPAESRTVDEPGRLLALALVGGVALDLGLRGGATNVAVTVGILLAVAVVMTRPGLSRTGAVVAIAATVPAVFLSVWASPWLAAANVAAVLGLGLAALAWSSTGSVLDTSVLDASLRALLAVVRGLAGIVPLASTLARRRSRGGPEASSHRTGLALLLALPLLAVLVALLASADAVFGSLLLLPDLDVRAGLGHVILAVGLAMVLAMAGLAVGGDSADGDREGTFGATDIAVVLGLAAAVLGLFVVSQGVALTDAGQRLVADAGLTPAEYARSGFFQLCWAAVVVVGYLALARRLAAPGIMQRPLVRALAATVPMLAVGLVAVSLRRMALYDQAFGLTMLRLSVVVAATWIGVVLLLVAARNLGVAPDRDWLPGVAVMAGLVLLLGANLVNPEAIVVRHNVARATQGATFDADYLATLSSDAVLTIARAVDEAEDPALRDDLTGALDCSPPTGVATLNLATHRAAGVVADLCS